MPLSLASLPCHHPHTLPLTLCPLPLSHATTLVLFHDWDRVEYGACPIVTRQAFKAFPCYEFAGSSNYLRADVGMVCASPEHTSAQVVALVAILLYTVGAFVFFAYLLFSVRKDKQRNDKRM